MLASLLSAAERPNIVWLLSEDNSIHYMQHYGGPNGPTPAISQLAQQGVTFNHAFSNSPVCSVARTTLMTGILGPRAGFHYHRKMVPANLPAGVKMVPGSPDEATHRHGVVSFVNEPQLFATMCGRLSQGEEPGDEQLG